MTVDYQNVGGVCVLSINNPPVNALNLEVSHWLSKRLIQAQKDDKIKAIVICGKGHTFSVGADLSEIASAGIAMEGVAFMDVPNQIENSKKPVIAAIHGNALGGGLEISLGCHYRIAHEGAKVGLPEVKIGLLPCATGTQRLPRVIGLENAMEWITSGKHYSIADAIKVGLVDKIIPDSVCIVEGGIEFAKGVVGKNLVKLRTSTKSIKDKHKHNDLFTLFNAKLKKRSRGAIAPFVCLEAVCNSAILPFQAGLKKELELFKKLTISSQYKAQIYAFFAQRETKRWTKPSSTINYLTTMPQNIQSAAVIGLGTMGRGIVISFLRIGIPVKVFEQNKQLLKSGILGIDQMMKETMCRGLITDEQRMNMLSKITATTDYSQLKSVDLVIEAVYESLSLKIEIFSKLDQFCKNEAILATNTSALNIDEIASVTSRPGKVIGMHFFAPSHIMKLLENVYGKNTDEETIATAMNIGLLMKKVPVLVGNCEGFVGNRMYINYMMECDFLLEEGAYPDEIDRALEEFGFAFGRYLVADLSGVDVLYLVYKNLGLVQDKSLCTSETLRNGKRYCPLIEFLCENKRYGQKSGAGWYDYTAEHPTTPIKSLFIKNIIEEYRKRNHITTRTIGKHEIIERALFSLINEGFKILEEGIASTPMDVDLVWLHGYAWPVHTGGPMFYASTIGLRYVLQRIDHYHTLFGSQCPHWLPSELLKYLVNSCDDKVSIYDWVPLWNNCKKSNL